ncbi:MAG TPA: histidine kinase, partial [Spongiibacteraceae bacterium]|nr:histidine kinase [Spongiibacteraceae bacterium]
MAERRDYIALDWVAGEIGETLEQAGQALAAFRDNPEDLTRLRFCLTHLHQVSGTLKMVEFSDAALLAEEAERLAQNLLAGKLGKTYIEDALTTLASVIQQLPAYLDGMRRKRRLLPAALIPLLNDLRAVRSQPLISETPLFTPALPAAVSGTATSTLPEAELLDVARKLRQMYQIALLGLLKGEDERSQLNYLAKVFARMARLAEGQPSQPLWRIAIAICEGLLNRSISRRPALNILLRQLDGPLRELTEQGSAALASPAPERLLRNLLFYVAASTADSRYIAEIKRDYALGDALPGAVDIDSDIVETPRLQPALAAIRQRLADAATQLDSISTPQQVMQVVGGLKPSVDASALLGLATTSGALQQLLLHLARLAQT